MTNTMKLQRFEAKKVYENEIKAMYAEGMIWLLDDLNNKNII